MAYKKHKNPYSPPRILSVMVAPDLTKCMQNTGGIEERSTFQQYRLQKEKHNGEVVSKLNLETSSDGEK